MPAQINIDDPRYAASAAEILRRHNDGAAEANITSAVRDFLILTRLAESHEIVEEAPPAEGSGSAVDLTTLNTFIEFKRRIGTTGAFEPSPKYVLQLDDYLTQSEAADTSVRMGILTDGKHWLLRWPNAGDVRTTPPYAFTLESADRWFLLHEWLRDKALASDRNVLPTREIVAEAFGPNSPLYERDIAALRRIYQASSAAETVRVKRRLWRDLLLAALGEIARTEDEMDDLFVRHTYLSAVIGMIVQASFGVDIHQLAGNAPADLLLGRRFQQDTGLSGIVESDFFAWPLEVGGLPLVKAVADRVARFDWRNAPGDIAAILYETVIPPDERRQLGEYYTPHWLARTMVQEVVTDPLKQHVLDPACGSGTFIAEAVSHFIEAAERDRLEPEAVLDKLRTCVTGIDVHPVAVHLARAAWVLAARPAIQRAADSGYDAAVATPIYLGDALQMGFRTGDLFAGNEVRLPVEDDAKSELVFPVSLVDQADSFDRLMSDVAGCIERGQDPSVALDDHGITDAGERKTLKGTITTLQRLHGEGRDHIWAYYTRNLVRPVALARAKMDVIVGNPPWLNYNKTANTLRRALEEQSKHRYGIWVGGKYATHQDVAGLFFARCTDLYLKEDGLIGMVMPHSALQAGHYSKWRTGKWTSSLGNVLVDFGCKAAWDLERLEPNTFFPVPASVVFARRVSKLGAESALAGVVERWLGQAGSTNVRREHAPITDTSVSGRSPYADYARQGAIIGPRCLFFVLETENPAIVQAGQTVTVNPRRGSQDKRPWRDLDLTTISGQTIETQHVYKVHLGETLAPYACLDPLKALLPLRNSDREIPLDPNGVGGIRLGGLERRMRDRWRTVSGLWEEHKAAATKLNLVGQVDYYGKLSSQLEWQRSPGGRSVRLAYTKSGEPTAAIVLDDEALIDHLLYWVTCDGKQEAHYLLAVINSEVLHEAVKPLMSKGQFGARDLHKHLWKLRIPEFDSDNAVHRAVADAGWAAEDGAQLQLDRLRSDRGRVTARVARRELRKWLQSSPEGQAVEAAVAKLLT